MCRRPRVFFSSSGGGAAKAKAKAKEEEAPVASQLRLFDFLWSAVWSLQLCKEYRLAQSQRPSLETMALVGGLTLSLSWCFVSSVLAKDNTWTRRWLATSGLLYLLRRGSSSNHVVLQALVSALVLFERSGGDQRRGARRLLGALYWVTALAKCNAGFFDRRESCAVLYAVAGGATAGLPRAPARLLEALPYFALAGEVWLACSFCFWERLGAKTKFAVVLLGSLFHCGLAAPAPPLSVYPFSLLMAPLFALAAEGDDARALRAFAVVFPAFLGVTLRFEGDFFEYPPYGSWRVGVASCLASFAAVVVGNTTTTAAALKTTTTTTTKKEENPRRRRPPRRRRGPHSALLLCVVGALPYLGVRTHPSFVMFSNLRVEAKSNHWLFTDSVLDKIAISTAARDLTTVTLADNFPAVASIRVDLGQWIQDPGVVHDAGASTEFIISPPAKHWNRRPPGAEQDDTTPTKNFSVPFLELRRRVSEAPRLDVLPEGENEVEPFRLEYLRHGRTFRLERLRNGTVVGDDLSLVEPLPWYAAALHRFRAVDLDHSPCRH